MAFILRRKAARAFTMMELILAIVIGMIVSVLGFSGFRMFNQEMPLKSTTRKLNHTFATARSFAIARNGYFQVTLDLDHHQYWVDQISNPALPPVIMTRNQKIVSPEKVDDRVKIEGVWGPFLNATPVSTGIQTFLFHPDGSIDHEGRITFYEAAKDPTIATNIYTLRIYGATGLSQIFPHERK